MSLIDQKSLLAKLMATENLTIRQARVDTASFDVLNRVLTVPILDQNLSKELYDLFMGHEVGHALYTPFEGMKKASQEKVNMSVLNVVEDSRIERKIKNKYPGIRQPFIKAYRELFERDFFGTEDRDINSFNFIDRINLHCKIGASLAINFNDEERIMLKEVESTETYDEVIEVTKRICEYMKGQIEENRAQKKKLKIKVVSESDENAETEENTEINPEDYDEIEIVDETTKVNSEKIGEEETESESESQSGNMNTDQTEKSSAESSETQNDFKSIEEEIRSFTDDQYRRKEKELFSEENLKYVYANIPKYDTSKIVDYKTVYNGFEDEGITHNPRLFTNYRKESLKIVSYLVKEFELRKNADQMKRASVSKTGDLNMNRLYSYKFTEDIFKKMTVIPQGKSHGLVMFIDWSGSMSRHLGNTIKQLMNLVFFCKKVNIPFEVYCFVEKTHFFDSKFSYQQELKVGDLRLGDFSLMNLISSRMSTKDFVKASSYLLNIVGSRHHYRMNIPSFLSMNGTPLNESIIAAMEIVPEFQKKYGLQVVNTVFLTDGEGNGLREIYGSKPEDRNYTHLVIRDPKTKNEEISTTLGKSNYTNWLMDQTDSFIRLLKRRTNSHVIGFFVGETKDITSRMSYFFPDVKESSAEEKLKLEFREKNYIIAENTGFDDYYILRSSGLDTDDEAELEFGERSTTRGMVKAFTKFTEGKINSRVILNRFIGLIA